MVIVIGFTLIGLFFKIPYMIYTVLAIGLICVFSEKLAGYVSKGWMAFGMFLGKINSTILLSLVFILMLTPLALLKRLTEKKSGEDQYGNWSSSENETVNFEKPW